MVNNDSDLTNLVSTEGKNEAIIEKVKQDLNETIQQAQRNDDLINYLPNGETYLQPFNFKLLGVVTAAFYFGMLCHGIYISRKIKREDMATQVANEMKRKMTFELQQIDAENSSNGSYYVRPKFKEETNDKNNDCNYDTIIRQVKWATAFIAIWLISLTVVRLIERIENSGKYISIVVLTLTSFLGGVGTGLFAQVSVDIVNISRSRKAKFFRLTLCTKLGHTLGPMALCYTLLYYVILFDSEPEIKFMSTFLFSSVAFLFCSYQLIK